MNTEQTGKIIFIENFRSFKYKAKLLGNTEPQADNAANGTLKNCDSCCVIKIFK